MARDTAQRIVVEAWRGAHVESRHEVWCAAAAPDDGLNGERPGALVTYLRSAAKPFQLLPLVADADFDRWGFEPADLAVMAGSHDGTDAHAARVGTILARLGLGEDDLRCGVHRPYFLDALPAQSPERLRVFGPLHNNCSGNHAAMLALAQVCGVPASLYLDPGSASQGRMHAILESLSGAPLDLAVDNCAAPCYRMPLVAMAEAYRCLAEPGAVYALDVERRRRIEAVAPLERIEAALGRIADAMATQPEWVTGAGSGYTQLVRAGGGAILAKHGDEGVLCVAHRGRRAALALKVQDGNPRALMPALLRALASRGWLDARARAALEEWAEPAVRGRVGQVVGALRAAPC